jgi:hypothetical protein
MRCRALLTILIAAFAVAAGSSPAREPFANAHVMLMARVQNGNGEPHLADVDVWAEGARLRARVRGERAELWIDGLDAAALLIVEGKVEEARRGTAERALQLALAPAQPPAHANTDRIAGRPCKVVTEALSPTVTLTRCLWRGLPLSVGLQANGFSFNAAATLVEEGTVTAAELQPPPGAPLAPDSMSAVR